MPPRRFKKKSVRKIVERRVAKAIEKYEKTRADSNNTGGSGSTNTGGTVVPEMHGCSYKTLMSFGESTKEVIRHEMPRDALGYVLDCTVKDLCASGDAEAIQGYFTKVQSTDREFFYAWELDEENTLKSLFWADARCRAAYEEFGDVVTSDATYLTNQYEMPMATFVRVEGNETTKKRSKKEKKENKDSFVPSDINHNGNASFPLYYGGFVPSYVMQHPQYPSQTNQVFH
ncbi:FAR-RED impaired response 1-like protein [Tanacetum coccineum]|uniref:FAR-RED impaired response 1-like protein n=1 Tax=Tanacetum coccineum TaxID=301880 RepID=A0ABQ4XYI5_9ASTR